MNTLRKDLRNELARTVLAARRLAEEAAGKALHSLGVDEADAPGRLDNEGRRLRVRLRAQARQLGDREDRQKRGCYEIGHLTEKIAYDHWHRLLFARFLAENDLLISPDHGVGISLDYCGDLAPEMGLRDGWEVAANFAARMLPEIFRADDPAGNVVFAPEDRVALRKLVTDLPRDIFLADDALGWVYQFRQAQRKEEVNKSGNKIGADEIAPVTQLFTEDYMVLFLLHNTLGAWWAGKVAGASSSGLLTGETEADCRAACALPGVNWEYLRFVKVAGASSSGRVTAPDQPEQDAPDTIAPDWETLAIRQGDNLPHWTCERAIYHVCFRLVDSIPQARLDEWRRERDDIVATAQQLGRDLTEDEEQRLRHLYSDKIEAYLDAGYGACWLARPEIADLVANALRHFDGIRYRLHAWCVMPNHVHVIVEPLPGHELSKMAHSWKSFTANEANKALGREGQFWQHEPYDHIIRNEREYRFQIAYVWENPDKARVHPVRWKVAGASCYGSSWKPEQDAPATIPDLLRAVGYAGKTLDDWLRNGYFEQHCQLFHQRPFIWQVWDGLRDGFSALVNYHKLDRRVLEKLIYVYLGDWIARQKAAVAAGEEGSDAKLAAAQKLKDNLEKILEGEAPYDIFVRWKPLAKQPIGWEPDLNDGVRLNIRPFVEAGILRRTPKIHRNKDRGKDVPSAPMYKLFQGDRQRPPSDAEGEAGGERAMRRKPNIVPFRERTKLEDVLADVKGSCN